jgi:hypothetical protein
MSTNTTGAPGISEATREAWARETPQTARVLALEVAIGELRRLPDTEIKAAALGELETALQLARTDPQAWKAPSDALLYVGARLQRHIFGWDRQGYRDPLWSAVSAHLDAAWAVAANGTWWAGNPDTAHMTLVSYQVVREAARNGGTGEPQ